MCLPPHLVTPLVVVHAPTAISGLRLGQMAVCGHPGAAGCVCGTPSSCGRCGWCSQSSSCQGDPVGPKGCAYTVLPLLGATSGVHQAQMAVCGHWGAQGLRQGSTVGSCGRCGRCGQAAKGTQWGPMGAPIWHNLWWVPPVGCTRAKWQCVASRGQRCAAALLTLAATVGCPPN